MVRFRLLTEADVRSVLTMDDLIETMASALQRFSTGLVAQPVRTVIPAGGDEAFFATMPAYVRGVQGKVPANFGEAGPNSANFGVQPSPGVRGAASRPFVRRGAPSAMDRVT